MIGDIGLTYDPTLKACDISFASGDYVLDASTKTPLIMAVGCDRRAEVDDELPTGGVLPDGAAFNPRRGTPIDALDPNGERFGSRMWLLERAKQSDETLQNATSYLTEATTKIGADFGVEVQVAVSYPRKGAMQFVVSAGGQTLSATKATG